MPDGLGQAIRSELRSPLAAIMWAVVALLLLLVSWDASLWHRRPSPVLWMGVPFIKTGGDATLAPDADEFMEAGRVVVVLRRRVPRGLLAPTRLEDRVRVEVRGGRWGPLAEDEVARLRAGALQLAAARNWEGLGAASIRPDGLAGSRPFWPGYALNAAMGVCAVGFVHALFWTARAVVGSSEGAFEWRVRRSLRRQRCPHCGYRIEGLARCPECGRRAW